MRETIYKFRYGGDEYEVVKGSDRYELIDVEGECLMSSLQPIPENLACDIVCAIHRAWESGYIEGKGVAANAVLRSLGIDDVVYHVRSQMREAGE